MYASILLLTRWTCLTLANSRCRTSARLPEVANRGKGWRSATHHTEPEVDGSVISPLARLHLSPLSLVGDRGVPSSEGQSAYRARTGFFPFAQVGARVEFPQKVYWRGPSPPSAL